MTSFCIAATLLPLVHAPVDYAIKSITSAGHKLTYEYAGSGTPVLILAGGPGLAPDYVRPIADEVSKKAKAVLLHQWGTGKSPIENGITISEKVINIDTAVADVDAMRKQLGVAKIVLLGHSWGGMLAQAYAAKHPTRTAKLILVASGGPDLSFLAYFSDNIDMRLTEDDLAEFAAAEKIEDFKKRTNEQLVARMPGYFYSRAKALQAKDEARKVLDFNSALMAPLLQRYDATKTVSRYQGPVFLIQGRQDPVDPSTAFQIKGLLPQTSMTWIEQCGHFPWIEQPQAFSKALSTALK